MKGRPEKERAWKKYGIREARLQLITRWAKRCSLHYERAQAHKKKRMRIVTNRMSELPNPLLMFELKGTPEKPGSKYHVQPLKMPAGSGHCVVCGKKTKLQCWGCAMELCGIFPVCPTSKRNCMQRMHQIRNEIETSPSKSIEKINKNDSKFFTKYFKM